MAGAEVAGSIASALLGGCPEQTPIERHVCVQLPGGAEVCVVFPGIVSSNLALIEQLMAQSAAAMAPLAPAFTVINVVTAIVEFCQAIPELITNPPGFAEALQKLIDSAADLAGIVPPLSIPVMVASMVDVLILFMQGMVDEIETVAEQIQRITSAQAILDNLPNGNIDIELAIECADDLVNSRLQDLQNRLASGGSFISLINLFMQMIGLNPIEPPAGVELDVTEMVESLENVIKVLVGVRRAIPV